MELSYIIVTYRSRNLIAPLLNSIHCQQLPGESEVIVIDNSPTESSADIVANSPISVRFIQNQANVGYTAAINQGIAETTGKYLFLLNPDVELYPDCVGRLIEQLKDVDIGGAAPQLLNDDGSIQKSVRNFPRFSTLIYDALGLSRLFPRSRVFGDWRNYSFDHSHECEIQQPMASALMLRREVVEQVGDWDEQFFIFFSDVDFCRRVIDAGYRIRFTPDAKAKHQIGGSTRREGVWLIKDSHRGFARYLRKHELHGAKTLLRPVAYFILWVGGLLRMLARKLMGRKF